MLVQLKKKKVAILRHERDNARTALQVLIDNPNGDGEYREAYLAWIAASGKVRRT